MGDKRVKEKAGSQSQSQTQSHTIASRSRTDSKGRNSASGNSTTHTHTQNSTQVKNRNRPTATTNKNTTNTNTTTTTNTNTIVLNHVSNAVPVEVFNLTQKPTPVPQNMRSQTLNQTQVNTNANTNRNTHANSNTNAHTNTHANAHTKDMTPSSLTYSRTKKQPQAPAQGLAAAASGMSVTSQNKQQNAVSVSVNLASESSMSKLCDRLSNAQSRGDVAKISSILSVGVLEGVFKELFATYYTATSDKKKEDNLLRTFIKCALPMVDGDQAKHLFEVVKDVIHSVHVLNRDDHSADVISGDGAAEYLAEMFFEVVSKYDDIDQNKNLSFENDHVSKEDELSGVVTELERLEAEIAHSIPKTSSTQLLVDRVSDLNPFDVTNVFNSRKKLVKIAEYGHKCSSLAMKSMPAKLASLSSSKFDHLIQNLNSNLKKLEAETQNLKSMSQVDDLRPDKSVNIQAEISQLDSEQTELIANRNLLMKQLEAIDSKIHTNANQLQNLRLLLNKHEASSNTKPNPVSLPTATQSKDIEHKKAVLHDLKRFESVAAKLTTEMISKSGRGSSKIATTDFEELMFSNFERYLDVEAFCVKHLELKTTRLNQERERIKKHLIPSDTKSMTAVQKYEKQDADLVSAIAENEKKASEIRSDSSMILAIASDAIFAKVQQAKYNNNFNISNKVLLPIWNIRRHSKTLNLEECLKPERFSEILPENIGKFQAKKSQQKKKQRKVKSPKAVVEAKKPGSVISAGKATPASKLSVASSSSANNISAPTKEIPVLSKPVRMVAEKPKPHPVMPMLVNGENKPAKIVTKSWGGWGTSKHAVKQTEVSNKEGVRVRSLLEIQEEEEKNVAKIGEVAAAAAESHAIFKAPTADDNVKQVVQTTPEKEITEKAHINGRIIERESREEEQTTKTVGVKLDQTTIVSKEFESAEENVLPLVINKIVNGASETDHLVNGMNDIAEASSTEKVQEEESVPLPVETPKQPIKVASLGGLKESENTPQLALYVAGNTVAINGKANHDEQEPTLTPKLESKLDKFKFANGTNLEEEIYSPATLEIRRDLD